MGVIERGEVRVIGMEGEGSPELVLEPPPCTTNGLTISMMLVVSVSVWSEATSRQFA